MIVKEYGKDKEQILLLLHGGGLSWWNYREEAELLAADYRVLLPILDGHGGADRPFSSIRDNASEILEFLDREAGGSVLLAGGLSLGGQVLVELLSRRRELCRHALVESAMVIPSRLTHALVGPTFGSSYGLVKNEGFARLQFRSLHIRPELFGDYYRDTCAIAKPDMISFLKASTGYSLPPALGDTEARLHVFTGERENRGIKHSAELLLKTVPGSTHTVLPGLYHGEFSLNHPRAYAEAIRRILRGDPISSGKELFS